MSDHRYEFIHKNHQRGHQCPGSFLHYSILTLKFLPGLALLLQIYPLQSWCIKIGKNFCAKGSLGAQWRAIHATGLLASPYTQWLACLSNQNAMCFQREFNRWAKRLAGDAAIKSSKLCDDTKIQRQKRCRNKKKAREGVKGNINELPCLSSCKPFRLLRSFLCKSHWCLEFLMAPFLSPPGNPQRGQLSKRKTKQERYLFII